MPVPCAKNERSTAAGSAVVRASQIHKELGVRPVAQVDAIVGIRKAFAAQFAPDRLFKACIPVLVRRNGMQNMRSHRRLGRASQSRTKHRKQGKRSAQRNHNRKGNSGSQRFRSTCGQQVWRFAATPFGGPLKKECDHFGLGSSKAGMRRKDFVKFAADRKALAQISRCARDCGLRSPAAQAPIAFADERCPGCCWRPGHAPVQLRPSQGVGLGHTPAEIRIE